MAHAKIHLNITPEWVRSQAAREPESGITSAGGLALRAASSGAHRQPDIGRHSLAKLVELTRRKMRLSVEQLADRANVELGDVLAIENAEAVEADPRTIYQLAQALGLNEDVLKELAGLVEAKDSHVGEAAMRFAARSESTAALTPEEEAALDLFLREMSKS